MLKLTQEMFSAADPELGSGTPFEALAEMAAYFTDLIADRQANPTDDLTSAIANATIDDEPLDMLAMMGLFAVLASAGHDTTSFAMSGDPDRLDVGRSNAPHQVGWGHGPHYCLGARLAQMEITSMLAGLARAVESIEPAGQASWTAGHFVSGVKHAPTRCRVA